MAQSIFPDYTGLVKLNKIKKKIGQQRYKLEVKTDEFNFETIIPGYNRRDAVFRARTYFPNGRFANVPTHKTS
jgi:hypothetical protein